MEMERHLTVLGVLFLVISIMGLFAGLITFIAVAGGGLISGDGEAIFITATVATIISSFLTLISLPGLIVGIGLIRFRPWARPLGLVLSVLNLLSIPIGTTLGIYGLVTLLKPEAAEFLESRG